MSGSGAAPRAAVPAPGAPTRVAAPASNARAEASRRNGAKSRGPRTLEGKARSSKNALKHGLRAQKHVVLPQEEAAEFAQFQAELLEELAPVGVLQTVLARRIVIAAWRLARADRMEAEVLEVRSYEGANPGVALIRDGNGTRSFETLMRYRNAAMAELTRALRMLKALQAESGERNARPATLRVPKEPKKARNSRSLVARTALVAAMPPARAATDRGPPCPEPSLASLLPALELIGARAARAGQTNPKGTCTR
ncbi:MAG TPA: hypothetical protein VHK45_04560 [Geminicoccaceae bacterium]|jgi:hypothetical protein|nr:hypothetical protein [Geminicoccaceae bacterium]